MSLRTKRLRSLVKNSLPIYVILMIMCMIGMIMMPVSSAWDSFISSTFTNNSSDGWENSFEITGNEMVMNQYQHYATHNIDMAPFAYNVTMAFKPDEQSVLSWIFSWTNDTLPALYHCGLGPVLVYDSTQDAFLTYDVAYAQYTVLMSNITAGHWYQIKISVNYYHTSWNLQVNGNMNATNIQCCDFTSGGYVPDMVAINNGPYRSYNNYHIDNITVQGYIPVPPDEPTSFDTVNWFPILMWSMILWLPAMLLGFLAPMYGTVIGVSLMGVVMTLFNNGFVLVLVIILAVSVIILWRSAR